jgi:hypothetical protein
MPFYTFTYTTKPQDSEFGSASNYSGTYEEKRVILEAENMSDAVRKYERIYTMSEVNMTSIIENVPEL